MKEHEMPIMPMKSRLSIISVEYGNVEVEGSTLTVMDKNGTRAQLPIGATAVLMLEPGTTITHAAVKLCAESRTLIIWTGEAGVRIYSAGQEGAAHTYRLLRQAALALNEHTRLNVAREMYRLRFKEDAPARRSLAQLRGIEGARVRKIYQDLSKKYGIEWTGRNYDRSDWGASDVINRAVSSANSCLYGVCHASILIAGYSPAIGFIHTGYPLAFVHDIADVWKMDLSVPVAFKVVSEGEEDAATRVRHELRDAFRKTGFLELVIPTIEAILNEGMPGESPPAELGGATESVTQPGDAAWYHNQDNRERADAAAHHVADNNALTELEDVLPSDVPHPIDNEAPSEEEIS